MWDLVSPPYSPTVRGQEYEYCLTHQAWHPVAKTTRRYSQPPQTSTIQTDRLRKIERRIGDLEMRIVQGLSVEESDEIIGRLQKFIYDNPERFRGQPGKNGSDGKDGKDGKAGTNGLNGLDGSPGRSADVSAVVAELKKWILSDPNILKPEYYVYVTASGFSHTRESDAKVKAMKDAGLPITVIQLKQENVPDVRDIPALHVGREGKTIRGAGDITVYLSTRVP